MKKLLMKSDETKDFQTENVYRKCAYKHYINERHGF